MPASASDRIRLFAALASAGGILFSGLISPTTNSRAQEIRPNAAAGPDIPDMRWITGQWAVVYHDSVLGSVRGIATIHPKPAERFVPDRVEVELQHRQNGQRYILQSRRIQPTRTGEPLLISLEGENPPSGGGGGTDLVPARADAIRLNLPINTPIAARVDRVQTEISFEEVVPYGVRVIFDVPAEGPIEKLDGKWEYSVARDYDIRKGRAGERIDAGGVTGPETWSRIPPLIFDVGVEGDVRPDRMVAQMEQISASVPADNPLAAMYRSTGYIGNIWITVGGQNLPVQPRRRVEIGIYEDIDRQHPAQLVRWTGNFRPNPKRPYEALDIEVALYKNIDASPKYVVLNGDTMGIWLPNGDLTEPLAASFVHRASATRDVQRREKIYESFETTDTVLHGDVFYNEAVYARPPFANRIDFMVVAQGQETTRLQLERSHEDPRLYHSGRLVMLPPASIAPNPDAVDADMAVGIARDAPIFIRAPDGARLLATEYDVNDAAAEKTIAVATVAASPPTLWQTALEEARACRGPTGGNVELTNYFVTELIAESAAASWNRRRGNSNVSRTISISLENHAAAILLWREVRSQLAAYAEGLRTAKPVADADLDRILAMRRAGNDHPLFNVQVGRPPRLPALATRSSSWTLKDALGSLFHFETEAEFRQYAKVRVADAQGKMLDSATNARRRLEGTSVCDVEKLIEYLRFRPHDAVANLLPKLVRPARPNEPAYPRNVPDRRARAEVNTIDTLAQAVDAQKAYARADTNVALALLTLPVIAVGGPVAVLVQGALDIAGTTAATLDWVEAERNKEFGLGVSGVAGSGRFVEAEAQARGAMMSVLLGATVAVGPRVLDGVVSGRIEVDDILYSAATARAQRRGLQNLSQAERDVFDALAGRARERLGRLGADGVSAAERRLLGLLDGDAASVRVTSTGPVGSATPPRNSGADTAIIQPRPDADAAGATTIIQPRPDADAAGATTIIQPRPDANAPVSNPTASATDVGNMRQPLTNPQPVAAVGPESAETALARFRDTARQRAARAEADALDHAANNTDISPARSRRIFGDYRLGQAQRNLDRLIDGARRAGVPEEEIGSILQNHLGNRGVSEGAIIDAEHDLARATLPRRGFQILDGTAAQPLMQRTNRLLNNAAGPEDIRFLADQIGAARRAGRDYFDDLARQGTYTEIDGFQPILGQTAVDDLRDIARRNRILQGP